MDKVEDRIKKEIEDTIRQIKKERVHHYTSVPKEYLKEGVKSFINAVENKMESIKNDQKDDKLRWDLLPLEEIEDIVRVYHAGAKKYGPNRWQHLPDGYNRYKAAMMRHLVEYEKGDQIDSDTGCLHLAQVAWNAIAMLYLSKRGEGCNQKKVEDVSCPEENEKHENHSPYDIYGNANLDDWLKLIHKYQTTKKDEEART